MFYNKERGVLNQSNTMRVSGAGAGAGAGAGEGADAGAGGMYR